MVQRKDKVKAEMDEVLGYLKLYQEAFPENPAFATNKKKTTKPTEASPAIVEEKKETVQQPTIDINKVVEDAFGVVADAVILATLAQNGAQLSGSSQQLVDSLAFVHSAWSGVTSGSGSWAAARIHFVDIASRLVFKSATQVGTHTSKSYGDLNGFVTSGANEGLFSEQKPQEEAEQAHEEGAQHEEGHHEEEKGDSGEAGSPTPEGEEGKTSSDRPHRGRGRGRGNYRGNFRKHNTDEEGFEVVKDEANKDNHYKSHRRGRGGFRGGEHRGGEFRGGDRGGEFRGGDRGGRGGEHRGRGGRGGRGGDRPWTEHKPREHRGRGEVRKTEATEGSSWADAPATTQSTPAETTQ